MGYSPISSKNFFYTDRITHTMAFVELVAKLWLERNNTVGPP